MGFFFPAPISTGASSADLDASLTADAGTLSVSAKLSATAAFDSAYLTGERSGYLEISGSGILLVSVVGTVSAEVSDVDENTYDAYSNSYIEVSLVSGALRSTGSLDTYVDIFSFDLLSDLQSGVISAALHVHDGDLVRFSVFAATEMGAGSFEPEPVPLPTSLPLFSSALLGLAAIKRGRNGRRAALRQI